MAKILITGGSGLAGRAISERLLNMGHEPRWLSREKGSRKDFPTFTWNISEKQVQLEAFDDVETVIHLAGAGIIDKRWTKSYKKQILDSRIKSSELLSETIVKNKIPVKTFIGASAVGYYGSKPGEHVYKEDDPAGTDFLSQVCVAWENSYQPFQNAGIRTVIIRTGIVLSPNGGAYGKMLPAFKLGLGAALASGRQYFPWIHVYDLAGIFLEGVANKNLSGIYNAVTTRAITNEEFSYLLAKSLNKPCFVPRIPELMLRLILGERAITITQGLKIDNQKIKAAGFTFRFDDLDEALLALRNS